MSHRVKVVTDSTSDLSPKLAQQYDITVVPCYVIFGNQTYRDGIDMNHKEFYRRLLESEETNIFPKTSQPSPKDFLDVYRNLTKETDQIVSIHVTGKLSGTYSTALQTANEIMKEKGCHIEVIDSQTTTMGLGFLAMNAGRLALENLSYDEIISIINNTIPKVHVIAALDTLKYLQKGGRIGKVQRFLGSALGIKPIITIQDGETHPYKRVRTHAKAVEELYEITMSFPIEKLAVIYTTDEDDAKEFAERLNSSVGKPPYITRATPALGSHAGPGTLGVALLEKS